MSQDTMNQMDATPEQLMTEANALSDQPEQALRHYQAILQQYPRYAPAYHQLGLVLHAQGAPAAISKLEQAIQLDAGNELYWVSYIQALMSDTQLQKASAAIQLGQQYGLGLSQAQLLAQTCVDLMVAAASSVVATASEGPISSITPENAAKIKIYQAYYSEQSRLGLDKGFIPFDNLINPRPDWREYWFMRQYFLNEALDEDTFYGFFSPKFTEKTGLSSAEVYRFIQANTDQADVILFSPFFDQTAFFLNQFHQGIQAHQGIGPCFKLVINKIAPQAEMDTLIMHSENSVYSNYFVAKPNFWRTWLAYCEELFHEAEEGKTALAQYLNADTTHENKLLPCKSFVFERIVSLMLATQPKWRVKAYDSSLMPLVNSILAKFVIMDEFKALDQMKKQACQQYCDVDSLGYTALKDKIVDRIKRHQASQLQQAIEEVYAQAEELQAAGELEKATALYEDILKNLPQHAGANHNLGFIETHTRGVESALPKFEAAVLARPDVEQYWVSLIDAYILSQDFPAAYEAIKHGQKHALSAQMAQLLNQECLEKTDSAWQLQKETEAASLAESSLMDHAGIEALLTQAQAFQAEGNYQSAKAQLQQVLQADPKHARANHDYGRLLAETEALDVALPYLEAAIANAPQIEQYWVTIIDAYTQLHAFKTVFMAISEAKKYALSESMHDMLYEEVVNYAIGLIGNPQVQQSLVMEGLIDATGLLQQIVAVNVADIQRSQSTGELISGNMDLSACEAFMQRFPALMETDKLIDFVRSVVLKLMWLPEFRGHKIFAPYFDQLLAKIDLGIPAVVPRSAKLANIVVATEVYDFGGHTKDIISMLHQVENPMLVITDVYARFATQSFYKNIQSALPQCPVLVLPHESLLAKSQRLASLINTYARNVFLLTHQDDVTAVVACQPNFETDYYFIHHADHNLAVGSHMPHLQHVDLFESKVPLCEFDLGHQSILLPTTSLDGGKKEFDYSSGVYSTVTAGTFAKFNTNGEISISSIIVAALKTTQGYHYHLGDIPEHELSLIYASLNDQGIAAEKFIYMGRVSSFWQTLKKIDAHIYLSSAPLGGGKAIIDAQGLGYPVFFYRESGVTPRHLDFGSLNQETCFWHTITELQQGIKTFSDNHLYYSQIARRYYEEHCDVQHYLAKLTKIAS
jgi:tetratricopeptide (TPR) repeat protein